MATNDNAFKFNKEDYWKRRNMGLSGTMPAPNSKQAKKDAKVWLKNATDSPEFATFKAQADKTGVQ